MYCIVGFAYTKRVRVELLHLLTKPRSSQNPGRCLFGSIDWHQNCWWICIPGGLLWFLSIPPPKKNGPFEDVFPIENGDIPASHVSLPEGTPFFWFLLPSLKLRVKSPLKIGFLLPKGKAFRGELLVSGSVRGRLFQLKALSHGQIDDFDLMAGHYLSYVQFSLREAGEEIRVLKSVGKAQKNFQTSGVLVIWIHLTCVYSWFSYIFVSHFVIVWL